MPSTEGMKRPKAVAKELIASLAQDGEKCIQQGKILIPTEAIALHLEGHLLSELCMVSVHKGNMRTVGQQASAPGPPGANQLGSGGGPEREDGAGADADAEERACIWAQRS